MQQDQMCDELLKNQRGLLDKLDHLMVKRPDDILFGLGRCPVNCPPTYILYLLAGAAGCHPPVDEKLLRVL